MDAPEDAYWWRHVRHFFGDKANMDAPEDAYWWRHVRRFFGDKANMDAPEDAYWWRHVRRFFGDKADMEDAPESADIFFTGAALAAKFAGKALLKHAVKRGARNWFSSWFKYA